jgi:HAD superfamily hydrolase (TIGR01509 family)
MRKYKAVIFDMDGVIIDSERLWQQAEFEVFTSLGVNVTKEYADQTKSMTTKEVTKFWFDKCPWFTESLDTVEQMVIARVITLVETEDCEITGIKDLLRLLKDKGYKIGLATNSPNSIIPKVLEKSALVQFFDTISSAEFEINGKPDPAVYLTTASKLEVSTAECIAIEDSDSGMKAAKNAGMTVVGFTNGNANIYFEFADFQIEHFNDFDIEVIN